LLIRRKLRDIRGLKKQVTNEQCADESIDLVISLIFFQNQRYFHHFSYN